MELLVIRHGETQYNAENRYLGALDPALTARGLSQAAALCAVLPERVDAILSSPLRRARQTAEVIGAERRLTPVVVESFRERNVGVFEGLTQEEAKLRHPELWSRNITRQWNAAPPGGETITEVVQRVASGLDALWHEYRGKAVVLVAHGFVAKTIRALCGAGFDGFFDWQLPNGQCLTVTLGPPSERTAFDRLCFADAPGNQRSSKKEICR